MVRYVERLFNFYPWLGSSNCARETLSFASEKNIFGCKFKRNLRNILHESKRNWRDFYFLIDLQNLLTKWEVLPVVFSWWMFWFDWLFQSERKSKNNLVDNIVVHFYNMIKGLCQNYNAHFANYPCALFWLGYDRVAVATL